MSDAPTLILPIQLASKNTRDKLHPMQRQKLKTSYRDIIALKYPRRSGPPTHRQLVTVTRVQGSRERDWDEQNIGAGTAIELIDAMTALGFWLDDSSKYLSTRFLQDSSQRKIGPCVIVQIEEI